MNSTDTALSLHDSPSAAATTRTVTFAPLLVRMQDVAELTSLSQRTLKRLVADSAIWGIVRIGRSVRFDRALVEDWVRHGCPRSAGPKRKT